MRDFTNFGSWKESQNPQPVLPKNGRTRAGHPDLVIATSASANIRRGTEVWFRLTAGCRIRSICSHTPFVFRIPRCSVWVLPPIHGLPQIIDAMIVEVK